MSAGPTSAGAPASDALSLTVHGPGGVVDLRVPHGAAIGDVATEYSRWANVPPSGVLYTRTGQRLAVETGLAAAGVVSGTVLVLAPPPAPTGVAPGARGPGGRGHRADRSGRAAGRAAPVAPAVVTGWCAVAAVALVLAGAVAALTAAPRGDALLPPGAAGAAVLCLAVPVLLALLPIGPWHAARALSAPAAAAAAAIVVSYDPAPERLPTALGIAGLAAALAAAVVRALDLRAEEGLRVWMVAGTGVFAVAFLAALLDVPPQGVFAVVLVAATFAARFVPLLAVDVPDQYLLDLERLAVTAWSARERPRGRRTRTVVPVDDVAAVARRAGRSVDAAAVAVAVLAPASSALLLAATDRRVDQVGALVLVALAAASLLLAARSFRHRLARAALRAAGLGAAGVAGVVWWARDLAGGGGLLAVVTAWLVVGGAVLVLVAVAAGRGWRSAWWARRAEVAEAVCSAAVVAALVPASGAVAALWKLTG
ncbi:hypothetical protein [Nocardioides sp.]|uniref:hypothetical protein n=1 Tax=Nocardioides sp. TaxID=35761 RepID=UPI003515B3F5